MKATFDLRTWMTENREMIISKYNKLTAEKFFNGISLKDFMTLVLNAMVRNNIKSEKRAETMLPYIMGSIYVNNSKVVAEDKITNKLTEKYNGTAYTALI